MLKNYLTIALRTLQKRPLYAAINGGGLALGIASCVLIGLFVRSEWAFDRFHADADRIYRAWLFEDEGDRQFTNTITPIPLGPQLAADFPEVEEAVRLLTFDDLVRRGERQFRERIHLADSAFFEVFSFPLLRGDAATALDDPNGIVLTEAMARKYFGDEDPLGQPLEVHVQGAVLPLTVTGVAADPPVTSSIRFDVVVPWASTGSREPSRRRSCRRWWSASWATRTSRAPTSSTSSRSRTSTSTPASRRAWSRRATRRTRTSSAPSRCSSC